MDNSFFIDQSGEVVEVPPDQAPAFAQAKGYVPASPQQISDFQTQQKFGTPGQAAIAGVEHAGSALTFGLSDVAERAAGVPAADMAAREVANPVVSAAGTGIGIAAPLVATLGAAGPAEGAAGAARAAAKLTAPSLISRAGEAAAELAPKALGKIGTKAVRLGTEGALYGAGNVVHEAALGDPNLTGQSVMASIGMAAMLGGTLGAGAGAIESLGGKLVAGQFGEKIRSMLAHAEDVSTLNATNAIPSDVRKVLEHKGEGIGREAGDLGILKSLTDGPETILDRSKNIIKGAGETIGKMTEAADASGTAPTWAFPEIAGEAQAKIGSALRREGSTIAVADQLDGVFGRYAQAYEGREMGVADLHALRQDLDDELYKFGRTLDPFQKATGKPLMRFRGHLSQEIEDGLKAGGQDVGEWKSANRAIEVSKTMETLAESGIARNAVNNPVHMSGMIGAAAGLVHGGPLGAAAFGLASEAVRRRGAATTAVLARGLRDLMEGEAFEGVVDHTASAIAAERKAAAVVAVVDPLAALSPETKAKLLGQFRTLNVANPGGDVGALSESTQARLVQEMHGLNLASSADVSQAGPGLSNEAKQKLLGQLHSMNLVNPSDTELSKLSPAARAKLEGQLSSLNITPQSRIGPGADTIAQTAARSPEAKATLALLAKTNEAINNKIARAISAIAQGAPKVIRGEVAAGVAHIFGHDPKDAAAAYQKRSSNLRQLAADPDRMSSALQAQNDGLQEHAPQTAQAMAVASARAVTFLASKLPPVIQPGPLEAPLPPTRSQIATFHRYQEAVQNPLGVLRQAQAGTLTPESIEALQTVYPALYAKIQGQIVGHLSNGKTIPYRQKLMLSMLLGKDLDGTLSGMAIARNQALFAKPQMPMAKAPGQQSKALGKMTVSDRSQSNSQRAAGARER